MTFFVPFWKFSLVCRYFWQLQEIFGSFWKFNCFRKLVFPEIVVKFLIFGWCLVIFMYIKNFYSISEVFVGCGNFSDFSLVFVGVQQFFMVFRPFVFFRKFHIYFENFCLIWEIFSVLGNFCQFFRILLFTKQLYVCDNFWQCKVNDCLSNILLFKVVFFISVINFGLQTFLLDYGYFCNVRKFFLGPENYHCFLVVLEGFWKFLLSDNFCSFFQNFHFFSVIFVGLQNSCLL